MTTPANSNLPSESSRIKNGFNDSFDDVVMSDLQPQTNTNAAPSDEQLEKWFAEGGLTYLSFTK